MRIILISKNLKYFHFTVCRRAAPNQFAPTPQPVSIFSWIIFLFFSSVGKTSPHHQPPYFLLLFAVFRHRAQRMMGGNILSTPIHMRCVYTSMLLFCEFYCYIYMYGISHVIWEGVGGIHKQCYRFSQKYMYTWIILYAESERGLVAFNYQTQNNHSAAVAATPD